MTCLAGIIRKVGPPARETDGPGSQEIKRVDGGKYTTVRLHEYDETKMFV
jgi:hypothetical protein